MSGRSAARAALVEARLFVVVARPALLLLLGLSAALGVAQGGDAEDLVALGRALLVVVGFVAFAVAVNDLSDVAVDRINLAGDAGRPLASGSARARQMRRVAAAGAGVALVAAAAIGPLCCAVTATGVLLAAAYSLPPVRLSGRGILGPLLLPLGFVAVPFLAGLLAVRPSLRPADLLLLGCLYLGFVGRILLKDFRDVRGDALLGKRTFLVRRGREATCRLSAALWVAGSAALLAVPDADVVLTLAYAVLVLTALALLHALSRSRDPRADEALVGAVAVVGRGLVVVLLVQYGTSQVSTAPLPAAAMLVGTTAAMVLWAFDVARRGALAPLTAWPGRRTPPVSAHPHAGGRAART